VNLFAGAGSGRFLALILPWCIIGLLASLVSLVTGWLVCCGVPESTGTRQLAHGTVGCVALAVVILVAMQVITMLMAPSPPEPKDRSADALRPPMDPRSDPFGGEQRPLAEADWLRAQAQQFDAQEEARDRLKSIARVIKVCTWTFTLALLGSCASFGLFLGAVGTYLRQSALRLWSFACAGLQGAHALWVTALFYLISPGSETTLKTIIILTLGLMLATYGILIYMVYQARSVVPAD
jgi:hypothetical protein